MKGWIAGAFILGMCAGGLAGWAVGRGAQPEPAPPQAMSNAPAAPATTRGTPAGPAPRVVVQADCEAPVAAIQTSLEACDVERRQLALELYGDRLEWTADIPDNQREAAFRQTLDDAIDACGGGHVAHMDCSEYPCMAVFFGGGPSLGASCAPWFDEYGVATSTSSRRVECADGRTVSMRIVSPTAQRYESVDDMMRGGTERDPVERERRSTRMQYRWDQMALDLPCPD